MHLKKLDICIQPLIVQLFDIDVRLFTHILKNCIQDILFVPPCPLPACDDNGTPVF